MPLINDIVNWGKNQLIYMTGRGLLGMGMILGAGAIGAAGASAYGFMMAAVIGTAATQAFITWRNEKRSERQMVTAYRDEVAAKQGMNPKDVSIDHLRDVAEGQPDIGLAGNPVLKEAITRNEKRHIMQFFTSGLAGLVVGVGALLVGIELIEAAGNQLNSLREGIPVFGEIADNVPLVVGSMFVAGTGMGILNQIFDRVGERVLNIHHETAHDKIMEIRRDITRGKMISQEQVFGVYVAARPELAAAIEQEFGYRYDDLNERRQHLAMEKYSKGVPTSKLTYDINHYLVDPEELAFAAVGQESGVPRKTSSNFKEEVMKEKTTEEILADIKREALGEDEEKAKAAEEQAEQLPAPANDNQHGFAARFVPREVAGKSHVERHAPNGPQSRLDKVLDELRQRHETLSERER